MARLQDSYDEGESRIRSLRAFSIEAGSVDRPPDFSQLDAAQLHSYRDSLIAQLWSAVRFRLWSEEIVAVESALLKGERDLATLQRIEHHSDTPIPGFAMHF